MLFFLLLCRRSHGYIDSLEKYGSAGPSSSSLNVTRWRGFECRRCGFVTHAQLVLGAQPTGATSAPQPGPAPMAVNISCVVPTQVARMLGSAHAFTRVPVSDLRPVLFLQA